MSPAIRHRTLVVVLALSASLGCVSFTPEFEAFIAPFEYEDAARAFPPVSVCPIHGVPTVRYLVESTAGMVVAPSYQRRRYLHAKARLFLYSYWQVYSGSCEISSFVTLPVCPACRDAERRWRTAHRWPSIEPIPLDHSVSIRSPHGAAPSVPHTETRLTPACSGLASPATDARR